MAHSRRVLHASLGVHLQDSESLATAMALPGAVGLRLERLVELARPARATQSEVIGMLIADAELDADKLEQQVIAYRRKTVGDVVRDSGMNAIIDPELETVSIPRRRPGRPHGR